MSDDPRDIISRHIERTTGIYDTDCADAIIAEIERTHAIVPKDDIELELMTVLIARHRERLSAAPPVAQGGEG